MGGVPCFSNWNRVRYFIKRVKVKKSVPTFFRSSQDRVLFNCGVGLSAKSSTHFVPLQQLKWTLFHSVGEECRTHVFAATVETVPKRKEKAHFSWTNESIDPHLHLPSPVCQALPSLHILLKPISSFFQSFFRVSGNIRTRSWSAKKVGDGIVNNNKKKRRE